MSRASQVERDERFQAFMDFARQGSVTMLLWQSFQLMNGQRDPFRIPERVQRPILDLAESDGWSTVIELIAQVQKEHEAAVRV